jgi:hypothetical protein
VLEKIALMNFEYLKCRLYLSVGEVRTQVRETKKWVRETKK